MKNVLTQGEPGISKSWLCVSVLLPQFPLWGPWGGNVGRPVWAELESYPSLGVRCLRTQTGLRCFLCLSVPSGSWHWLPPWIWKQLKAGSPREAAFPRLETRAQSHPRSQVQPITERSGTTPPAAGIVLTGWGAPPWGPVGGASSYPFCFWSRGRE